jgi:hypothetical protein
MAKPRIMLRRTDFAADDAEAVLRKLGTGELGTGRIRYRRIGGAFCLAETAPLSVSSLPSEHEPQR